MDQINKDLNFENKKLEKEVLGVISKEDFFDSHVKINDKPEIIIEESINHLNRALFEHRNLLTEKQKFLIFSFGCFILSQILLRLWKYVLEIQLKFLSELNINFGCIILGSFLTYMLK